MKPLWVLLGLAGVGGIVGLAVAFAGDDDSDAPPKPTPDPNGPTPTPTPTDPTPVDPGLPLPCTPPGAAEFNDRGIEYAWGSPTPRWPLRSTARKVSDDFGNDRDGGTRIHVGEDLPAPEGTLILACEAGRIVRVSDTWYSKKNDDGVVICQGGHVMLQTDCGVVLNFGETKPGSILVTKGQRVVAGQPLARVSCTDQLHFECYRYGTTKTARWMAGDPAPASILDPHRYLLAAAKDAGIT